MTDLRSAKMAARERAKLVRDALSDPAEREAAALRLRDRFLDAIDLDSIAPREAVVGGYWPLGSEMDVLPLLRHLRSLGRTVALPISGPRGQALTFRDWDPALPMVTGRYGISEPGPDRPELAPSVVLVPLLAFDGSGRRLGYGAGYYDRTLDGLRARGPVTAIGIAFAAQRMDAVPVDEYDQPLDWIVTDREALRF
ncbi:5-formyltetrahydrofolate cyclo-ligase [Azospirillum sp. SYSU D00513]|uniref:5-formyltetrahydrofolate cyclo-ligase n=1 Tax=Azospirillum sp. SYSU D00513 TaxID=2812561 RepID=UPI001A964A33|nr:5-formyltetrahydrofolate cyclo-ligase [Azospirillum sp. SYSU D00513]